MVKALKKRLYLMINDKEDITDTVYLLGKCLGRFVWGTSLRRLCVFGNKKAHSRDYCMVK